MSAGAAPTMTIDPGEPGFYADPYPQYARLRRDAPVHQHPAGPWMVFADVHAREMVRDPRLSNDERKATFDRRPGFTVAEDSFVNSLVTCDPPDHTRLRRVVAHPFRPDDVSRFATRLHEITEELLAPYGPDDVLEVVSALAHPLAYKATCEFIGMPTGGNDAELMRCTDVMVGTSLEPFATDEQLRDTAEAIQILMAHIAEAVAWKREHPGDDMISDVLAAAEKGTLSDAEALFMVQTLFLAGDSSTVSGVALAMHALVTHPDQWRLLTGDPALLPGAVEELLRYDTSIQLTWRQALTDYVLDDVTIPQGSHVLIFNASANRDPDRWGPTADTFDITRRGAQGHLAFGAGPHTCIGLWLARAELRAAIGALAQRFPHLEQVDEPVRWNPLIGVRGPEELGIRLAA